MYATVVEAGDPHRRLLTKDWLCRKARKWPLLEYVSEHVVEMSKVIYTKFPVLEKILKKYSGKLALCGGLVSTVFHITTPHGHFDHVIDADIFFYGVTEDEANQILIDCVAIIASEENYTDDQNETNGVRIERRTRITNVTCRNIPRQIDGGYIGSWSSRIYQFVHRIYPSLDSILGGFDLGHAMIAMTDGVDGPKIFWTEMGQWSNTTNTILVDTSRRSTSYEHRIIKYVSRFRSSICIPGVSVELIPTHFSNLENTVQQISKAAEMIHSLGLRPKTLVAARSKHADKTTSVNCIASILMDNFKIPRVSTNGFQIGRLKLAPGYEPKRVVGHFSYAKLGKELGSANYLTKYSDYSHATIADSQIVKANNTALRCNNIDAVMATFSLEKKMPYEYIVDTFNKMITHPVVLYDVRLWQIQMQEGEYRNLHTNMRVKLFGTNVSELQDLLRKAPSISTQDKIEDILHELEIDMQSRADQAKRKLVGIQWITNNPGRQWTSSINPEVGDPRDYYGREHYTSFTIGIPSEIETAIRLGFHDPNSPLRIFKGKRDLIRLIFHYICLQYV